jgi:hypothetical protein
MLNYVLVYQEETDGEILLETVADAETVTKRINDLMFQGLTDDDYAVIRGNIIKDFVSQRNLAAILDDEYPQFSLAVGEGSLDDPGEYCCDSNKHQLSGTCRGKDKHMTGTDQCPDQMICYNAKLREYSLNPVGHISYTIRFCPSCGHKFPESLRDEWYSEIEKLGLEVWADRDKIPEKFKSDAWWKNRGESL